MLPLLSPADCNCLTGHPAPERRIVSSEEAATAQSFSLEKRRREWLTTRICAKLAAVHYREATTDTDTSPLFPEHIRIDKNGTGRPNLAGTLPVYLQDVDLSLSHGAEFGLALVADCRCGIDIEAPREALHRARDKFCTPEEDELLLYTLNDLPEKYRLCLLWAAKEAVKKALSHSRMPGFLELILTELEPHVAGWGLRFLVSSRQYTGYPPTVTVAGEVYERYSIALCLSLERPHA